MNNPMPLFCLSLASGLCAQGARAGAAPREPSQGQIMESVEAARNLKFERLVHWKFLAPREFQDASGKEDAKSIPAFYDWEEKLLIVKEGFDLAHLTPIITHEAVHALQDQHFDLSQLRRNAATTDAADSLRALVEGDATFTLMNCCLPANQADDILAAGIKNPWQSVQIAGSFFDYTVGARFIKAVHEKSGWPGVDALYAGPPLSTEQILHPEKYFKREQPVAVSMPAASREIRGGWTLRKVDTLGEFQLLRYFLNFQSTKQNAAELAAGWGGDAMYTYENGGKSFSVQKIVWDTPQEAEEFFEGARSMFAERHSGLNGEIERTPGNGAFARWTDDILLDGVYWNPADSSTALFFNAAADAVDIFLPGAR